MNEEEIQSLVDQLRGEGKSDEDILEIYYQAFTDGKMDRKDLEELADFLGYELTDDFKNDPTPDPIAAGGADAAGLSEEDLEDAKEIDEDETPEEFEEKLDDMDGGDDDDADDDDWEEAQKLFKI